MITCMLNQPKMIKFLNDTKNVSQKSRVNLA